MTQDLIAGLRDNKPAILARLGVEKPSNPAKAKGLNPSRPPRTRDELVWLIDYLSDPKAFATWFEELMQRDDTAEFSE